MGYRMTKRNRKKFAVSRRQARHSKHDPSVPIIVTAREIIGLTDRDLIGNAFLSRLEHFGVRQDRSEETRKMRATPILSDKHEGLTVGIAIDRYLASICDVIVDAFQALPSSIWDDVAVEIGLLSPCQARPVHAAADPSNVEQVAEILRLYDRMSLRSTNVVRAFLGLPPVELEAPGSDENHPKNRRARRALGRFYVRAANKFMRTPDKIPEELHVTVLRDVTEEERARYVRQTAPGRTIRVWGYDTSSAPARQRPP